MPEKNKILLIDDKKENLFALETLLEDLDVDILQTTSGLEGLKIALENEIATILLDVQMPEIDGYEVAKLLKRNSKTRNIPIIFVTAINQEQEHVIQGYETGAVDYLFKPLNPSVTVAKVKAFITLYQQQKELEQKNIELENLNMLVHNAVDLMCILNENTLKIENINPSWLKTLGHSTNEIIQSDFINFVSGPKEDFRKSLLFSKNIDGRLLNHEVKMLKADGSSLWFSWCFIHKNGKWYGNGRNITDRKSAEYELNKANEELELKVKQRTKELEEANNQLLKTNADLDSFVYTASHDLKLPIANLEGLYQSLQDELTDVHEEALSVADMFGQCIIQLKDTINDLIGIIKKSNKETDELIYKEDCEAILDEITLSIQDLIQSNSAEVQAQFNGCIVNFPKPTFKSILYNLITNAIKYRSDSRTPIVNISISEDGNYNVLQVKDNGVGISEEGLNILFEKFQRLNQNERVEGSGIGLFIVKNSVEKYGGKIEVESEVGQGSTFKVFFPKRG